MARRDPDGGKTSQKEYRKDSALGRGASHVSPEWPKPLSRKKRRRCEEGTRAWSVKGLES